MILKVLNEIDTALESGDYTNFCFKSGQAIGLCTKYKIDIAPFNELSHSFYSSRSGLRVVGYFVFKRNKNLLRRARKELLNGSLGIGEKYETA
jgi:hypothetical protein